MGHGSITETEPGIETQEPAVLQIPQINLMHRYLRTTAIDKF